MFGTLKIEVGGKPANPELAQKLADEILPLQQTLGQQEAINRVIELVDDCYQADEFATVDVFLQKLEPVLSKLEPGVIVALFAATWAGWPYLLAESFFKTAEEVLKQTVGAERTGRLLKGFYHR